MSDGKLVGRTYLERGEPVVVEVAWFGASPGVGLIAASTDSIRMEGQRRGPVRNVLIRRANGELVVRPFRGLRRAP